MRKDLYLVKKISKTIQHLTLTLFLLVLVSCSMSENINSKTIYVSPSGSDENSGQTINEPISDINKAIEEVSAGDTIFLLKGTYQQILNLIDKNGKPDQPILIRGYSKDSSNFPIIDGGLSEPSNSALNFWALIKNSSWITFENIKFINGWTDPIQLKNSSYISFNSCRFFGARHVIWAKGESTHHLLIENCFWDQGGEFLWEVVSDSNGVDGWTSMHHEAMEYFNGSIIDFRGTGGSVVIRNNTIQNAFNAIRWRGEKGGYDSNVEIYGNHISQVRDNDFEPETYAYNLHIYHNFSHNIHRTLSIDNVTGGDIYYYGNVITTDNEPWTQKICVNFWKIYGSENNLDFPLYLFNNSFYGCSNSFRVDEGKAAKVKHFNNAYYFSLDNGWIVNKWDSTDEFDYDISNKEWASNLINNNQEQHGKIADIKYVDPSNQNLKLQNSSPGIDAGKIMSFPEFDWTQWYSGSAPDVGAYENGNLVEGPAFRFRIPPGANLDYKEKPRIVRNKIEGNKLLLFISIQLDKSTINKNDIELFDGENKVEIKSVELIGDNYELVIESGKNLSEDKLSIAFKNKPFGLNGEELTYWASTIKIHK